MARYTSVVTPLFQEHYANCLTREQKLIDRAAELLETMPSLGVVYDPKEDDPTSPVEGIRALYVPNTSKTLYYVIEREQSKIYFITIGDSRADPRHRFAGVHESR